MSYRNNQVQIEGQLPNYWPDLFTNINAKKEEQDKETCNTNTKEKKLKQKISLNGEKKALKNTIGTTAERSMWATDQIIVQFPECANVPGTLVFERYTLNVFRGEGPAKNSPTS